MMGTFRLPDDAPATFWGKVWRFLAEDCWWAVQDFWRAFVWPANAVRNFLWRRYDLVRLPQVKRHEYSDVVERMLWANAELLRHFLDEEDPEGHVEWYGEYGLKYTGDGGKPPLLPEFEGRYVMDLLKEAYAWFTDGRARMKEDLDCLYDVWRKYFSDGDAPSSLEAISGDGLPWEALDRLLGGDRSKVLDHSFLLKRQRELEDEICMLDQKYLHLIIECRFDMWT